MSRDARHDMLPQATHDERARQEFVVALKQCLNRTLRATNRRLFETVVAPDWERSFGATPVSREAIRDSMYQSPAYRSWSSLHRTAQELMWASLADTVFRDSDRLSEQFVRLARARSAGGSLRLDPSVKAPRSIANLDIHLQTGGYLLDRGSADVAAGAFYEVGGNLYAFGQGISRSDSKATHVQRFLSARFPRLAPLRILDMGCSAGSSSVPYAIAFREAEVHAIDVAPAILRYAHARAESLGARVHFHQMDAAHTQFPDAHFDLIVSHNMMHEIPEATRRGILRETWRLLAAGGVAVHQDVPLRFAGLSEFQQFEYSWDTRNNNEPYWEVYANADLAQDASLEGIPATHVYVGSLPEAPGTLPWFVCMLTKPDVPA